MTLETFDRVLRLRVKASLGAYAIFAVMGVHAALTGWLSDSPTPVVVALLISYFLLPRGGYPKGMDLKKVEDEEAFLRVRRPLEMRFRRIQLAYFFGAFMILAMLPFVLGEPVFQSS